MTGRVALVTGAGSGIGRSLAVELAGRGTLLALSDIDYHGRMQSMVVLGFSGFGLAALPLGLLADALTLEVTLAAMGVVVLAVTAGFVQKRRQHRRRLIAVEFA